MKATAILLLFVISLCLIADARRRRLGGKSLHVHQHSTGNPIRQQYHYYSTLSPRQGPYQYGPHYSTFNPRQGPNQYGPHYSTWHPNPNQNYRQFGSTARPHK